MVELDVQKAILVEDEETIKQSELREERQRTGRYIAVGTAIFLSLLGLYQAVARGTPQYAALFAPALIMFIYILWILYASKNQRKAMEAAHTSKTEGESVVEIEMDYPASTDRETFKDDTTSETRMYSRSYSIA